MEITGAVQLFAPLTAFTASAQQDGKVSIARWSIDKAAAVAIGMQWPLDSRIYDLPLTLKLAQPADGLLASVTAGGKAIPCSFQTEGGQQSLLIDVPAQTSNIRVERHR
jgi:hypothetical protein